MIDAGRANPALEYTPRTLTPTADAASVTRDGSVDPARARQTLGGAPLWARFATVAAGPVFNFILAMVVFAALAGLAALGGAASVVMGVAPVVAQADDARAALGLLLRLVERGVA